MNTKDVRKLLLICLTCIGLALAIALAVTLIS